MSVRHRPAAVDLVQHEAGQRAPGFRSEIDVSCQSRNRWCG
jgi:hypothetical protein